MFRQLALLAVFCLAAASAVSRRGPVPARLRHLPRVDEKIVGGDVVTPNSLPYQVSMQFGGIFGFSHGCGGSVMNEVRTNQPTLLTTYIFPPPPPLLLSLSLSLSLSPCISI